jgi:hypothetical protein
MFENSYLRYVGPVISKAMLCNEVVGHVCRGLSDGG